MLVPGSNTTSARGAFARSLYELTKAVMHAAYETECSHCKAGAWEDCDNEELPLHAARLHRGAAHVVSKAIYPL